MQNQRSKRQVPLSLSSALENGTVIDLSKYNGTATVHVEVDPRDWSVRVYGHHVSDLDLAACGICANHDGCDHATVLKDCFTFCG